MFKQLSNVMLMSALALLVACDGGGSVDRVDNFISLLNSQSSVDSTFYLAKHPNQTLTQGFVVVYSAETGYLAYDISNYQRGDSWYTYAATAEYQEVYIYDSYSDAYGEVFYVGSAFANDTFSSYAGEFVFEQTEESFKDVEKVAALKDSFKTAKLGEVLSSSYGLSEGRGQKVAKLVVQWERLSKGRKMTTADADAFTQELLGVDMTTATLALTKPSSSTVNKLEDLLAKAATLNGVSPEHMEQIITDFVGHQ